MFVKVAVPVPLCAVFDYSINEACSAGVRVLVPFAGRTLVGVVIETSSTSSYAPHKIKAVQQVLDSEPVLAADIMQLANIGAKYYAYPLGLVFANILPARMARNLDAGKLPPMWQLQLPADWQRQLKTAKQQYQLVEFLQRGPAEFDGEYLNANYMYNWRQALNKLAQRGWLKQRKYRPPKRQAPYQHAANLELNAEQQQVFAAVEFAKFAAYLLHGITGSGKTEVYLQLAAQVLAKQQQVLVLVPEIGLTPQLLARFKARFAARILVMHSMLSDDERLFNWQHASAGNIDIVIGTRSALFMPLPRLGLIVVDECHDSSFKQQDKWRYNARDLAVLRAQLRQVPVLLGSATPAFASLQNVATGRYQGLYLRQRAGGASEPSLHLVDMRQVYTPLSPGLLQAMQQHLSAGNQVMLFLNRRGYATLLQCPNCGWHGSCANCDNALTMHQQAKRLCCHYCGAMRVLPKSCPQCSYSHLDAKGVGTEQLQRLCSEHFADYKILRVDRDTMTQKGSLERALQTIANHECDIIIGTQLLAKGHHFAGVTLVGAIDSDRGFYSGDFHGGEHCAQVLLQVAGRAGRAAKAGEVLVQTRNPENPELQLLLRKGYAAFAKAAIAERAAANLPPHSYMAILRTDAAKEQAAIGYCSAIAAQIELLAEVEMYGPLLAPRQKLLSRYRAQLIFNAPSRSVLQQQLQQLQALLGKQPSSACNYSIDVDPLNTF